MRSRTPFTVGAGHTGKIFLCLLVCLGSTQLVLSSDDARIQIAFRDNEIQIGTDVTKPFFMQWRTPTSRDWVNWTETTLPDPGEACVWMRAVFEADEAFDWEVPADVSAVYSPVCPSDTPETGGWVTIGQLNENGSMSVAAPADYLPPEPVPSDSPADTPRNNQAMATPDPGRVKVFWYNTSSRLVACWGLTATGGLKSAGFANSGSMSSGWVLKGAGDINRDGVDDLIWHNANTRMVAYWMLAKDGYLESSGLCNDGGMSAGWELKGVGDINKDGTVDLFWHNSSTKRVAYWMLNADGTLASSGYCNDGTMTGGWVLSGVGDIDNDGTADVLWHNSTTRKVAYWMMKADGTLNTSGYCSTNSMASGWEFRAVGDIDNDGTTDIFWHNSSTKRVAYWILKADGTLDSSGFCNDGVMSSGWVLEAAGDINNDGSSDLLWYNSSTRMVAYWLLNSSGTMTAAGFCNSSAMSTGWALEASGI